MKLLKKWLLLKLCLVLAMPLPSLPQALPKAQPDRVNRAVSGVLQNGMRSRGFAANDPRFGNTLARISPHLSAIAGGSAAVIAAGAITAPAWASVALAAGIGTVVTYAVTLAIDGIVRWLFNESTVDVSSNPGNTVGAGIVMGGSYWSAGVPKGTIYGGDGIAIARQSYSEFATLYGIDASPNCTINTGMAICKASKPDEIGSYLVRQALYYSSGAPSSCTGGHFFLPGSGCMPFASEGDDALMNAHIQAAITAMPETELDKKLSPEILAGLANRIWEQAASQPGYDGLPYSQSNPITAKDAIPWIEANPEYAPTVEDFVRPNPVSPSNPNPWAIPSNPTSPIISPVVPNGNTTNPAAEKPQVNLGPDPGIGSPTLEATPTAQQIVQPILNLAPELRGFQASTHSGSCPKPSFELFNSTHTLDAHCKLIDDNKSIMQAAMRFAWAAFALFIILSA